MAKDFKLYAGSQLKQIYQNADHKDVHSKLCGHEPNFALINENLFGLEYLAARLAVACRAWEAACDENGITDDESKKAFLRAVMDSFKSSKFLNIATAFSEYHLTINAETGPVVPIVEHFFTRLKIIVSPPSAEGGQVISDAFQMMFFLSESFRTDFENQFFEFTAF